jgi:hypothetical protein
MCRGQAVSNAFVYVKSGLPPRTWPAPAEAVELAQRGLEFVPRVFGLRVGQTLRITSQDSSPHNVFCQPFQNAGFNQNMTEGEVLEKRFDRPEAMIELRCHLHAAMFAFAGVLDHPFFAVTDRDGRFTLQGLPPGRYRIAVWDEGLGSKEFDVDFPAEGLAIEIP